MNGTDQYTVKVTVSERRHSIDEHSKNMKGQRRAMKDPAENDIEAERGTSKRNTVPFWVLS